MTHARARAGFTLAEVAVTLVIVGIGLVFVLQGVNLAKVTAAHTHYRKVARDLALVTLGQIESGLYWEELDGTSGDTLSGTYAEEGFEAWHYEVVLGEEEFTATEDEYGYDQDGYHDSWLAAQEREDRAREDQDQDEEEITEPFEKVRIKVTFPKLGERDNALVLERWIPWDQVYGAPETPAGGPQPAEGQ